MNPNKKLIFARITANFKPMLQTHPENQTKNFNKAPPGLFNI